MKYNSGRRNNKFNNLNGKRFGRLVCTEHYGFTKDHHRIWKCKCDCGNECNVLATNLLCKRTISCGCAGVTPGKTSIHWKGYEEISGCYWGILKFNALKRNIEFNITMKYAWEMFLKQHKKCALSGISLTFPKTKQHKSLATASLDRIDSSKGYVSENIQWVHKDINKMKMDFPEEYFVEMCRKVTNNK